MTGMSLRRAFWIFALLAVLVTIQDRLLFILLPIFLLERNFSATEIGLIFSFGTILLTISRFFIGKISDIWGRKRMMSIGLFIQSISVSLFPSVRSLAGFSLIKGLKEVSYNFVSSVDDALLGDAFPKNIRGKYIARIGTIFLFMNPYCCTFPRRVFCWQFRDWVFWLFQ